jgi:Tol biopolymer transport system component
MTDHDVRDFLERMATEEPVPFLDPEPLARRARRRAARTAVVGAVGIAAAIAVLFAGVAGIRTTRIPAIQPTPTPSGPILRSAGEVLLFTPTQGGRGELVAVTPGTGEERVLVETLSRPDTAQWSSDGRWVAFEMTGSLWVVDGALESRSVFEAPGLWAWSSTGAQLAVIRGSTLSVVDPSTGLVTELASIGGDVTSAPAWSPDGTKIVYGARGGSVYSVDVRTGERSLLVQLPGEGLDSVDGIEWSLDGSRLAIDNDLRPGSGRLFVLNADGSDIVVLAENESVWGVDWSPDGSRIAFSEDQGTEIRVFVALADGSARSLVASLQSGSRGRWSGYKPAWSPDGSRIALGQGRPGIAILTAGGSTFVIDADGSGDAVPLDDLTYESWRGGGVGACRCDIFG